MLTNSFVKIYDVSKDIISPKYCINIFEGLACSIAIKQLEKEKVQILVGSSIGKIYTHVLDLTEVMDEQDNLMLVEYLELEGDFSPEAIKQA